MYEVEYEDADGATSSIQFNLCEKTARMCPDEMNDYANIINGVETCNHLSRTLESNTGEPGTLSLISKTSPDMGVIMTYEGGNMCNDVDHYSLTVQINCNPNIEKTTYHLDKASIANVCTPKIIMNSPHACPVLTTGALGKFVEQGRFFIAIPAILIGLYLVSVGGRYPTVTLALFTTIIISLALLAWLYMAVLPTGIPTWTVWITGTVCLGLGAGLGFGAARWPKIGIMTMGFSIGTWLGFQAFKLFGKGIQESGNTTAKWGMIFGIAIFAALFCTFLFDHAVIITSCLFGAFFFCRVSIVRVSLSLSCANTVILLGRVSDCWRLHERGRAGHGR